MSKLTSELTEQFEAISAKLKKGETVDLTDIIAVLGANTITAIISLEKRVDMLEGLVKGLKESERRGILGKQ